MRNAKGSLAWVIITGQAGYDRRVPYLSYRNLPTQFMCKCILLDSTKSNGIFITLPVLKLHS